MRDAKLTVARGFAQFFFELDDLADRAPQLQRAVAVEHRHTGRVIAAVFEPMQTVDENGADITGGDGADDSAHGTGSETGTERDFRGSAGPARRIKTAKKSEEPSVGKGGVRTGRTRWAQDT